jgi:hypothetical protein
MSLRSSSLTPQILRSAESSRFASRSRRSTSASPADAMWVGDGAHYLGVGMSAIEQITSIVGKSCPHHPNAVRAGAASLAPAGD